jgi:hypothetical protein
MNKVMEKLQGWVSATSLRFVSAPYLPGGLICAAWLLAYTHLSAVLVAQPAAYWVDHSRAESSLPWLQSLLAAGVLPCILVGLLYLGLVWLVLTVLTRSLALVVWLPVAFVHLSQALTLLAVKSGLAGELPAGEGVFEVGLGAVSALALGIILVLSLLPHRKPLREAGRLGRWFKTGSGYAWVIAWAGVVLALAVWPRSGWMPLHAEHTPGPRSLSAVAYDSARQRTVLFGGLSEWLGASYAYKNDTWEWNGQDWIEMHPQTTPLPRAGHAMAYDEKRGVVVLFGGQDKSSNKSMFSDTWEWDGKDWHQMPYSYPAGRRGAQLFYDRETQKVILTGGFYYNSEDTPVRLDDSWAWDGETWEPINLNPQTLTISGQNVAYDAVRGRSVLYNCDQVMQWTAGQWREINMGLEPPVRFGPWFAGDPESGKLLLFGGIAEDVRFNDTWLLDGDTWQELHPNLTPSPRDAYVMFFDPTRHSFIIYGGMDTQRYSLDDMWEYRPPESGS